MAEKCRYKGAYNFQGEIHVMWTVAKNKAVAHRNFVMKLARKLGFISFKMRLYFIGDKDNFKIRRMKDESRSGGVVG